MITGREHSSHPIVLMSGFSSRTIGDFKPLMHVSCFYYTNDKQDE